jgi:hypothetical protein
MSALLRQQGWRGMFTLLRDPWIRTWLPRHQLRGTILYQRHRRSLLHRWLAFLKRRSTWACPILSGWILYLLMSLSLPHLLMAFLCLIEISGPGGASTVGTVKQHGIRGGKKSSAFTKRLSSCRRLSVRVTQCLVRVV